MDDQQQPPMMALGGIAGGLPSMPYWLDWGRLIQAIGESELPYLSKETSTFDATVSRGVFWKHWQPDLLVTNDIDPRREADWRWDWFSQPAPLDLTGRFGAAVFDPPFKLAGKNVIMLDRYGLDGDDPNLRRMAGLIVGALASGDTVEPGGYLLAKCQPQVASKRYHDQPRRLVNEMEHLGWEHVDTFLRQYRPIDQPSRTRKDGKTVVQEHSRRNYSELVVLKKTAATRVQRP